jgi:hemerythrin
MPLLKWYKKYSVNDEVIDKQHQILFSIFNRLHANFGSDENNLVFKPLVDDLVFYANYHFKLEEELMLEVGYQDIARHVQEHEFFSQKVLHLQSSDAPGTFGRTIELIAFLSDWLLHHVIEEDRKIVSCRTTS